LISLLSQPPFLKRRPGGVSGSVRHLRFLHELNLHSVDWMFRQICSNRVLQDQCLRRDVEEYLHLAMYWRSLGNHRACMSYLQELLRLQPRHALAIYLLAAQHGEIGSHERAIKGMRAALAINPRLYMARFQLGLLLLHVRRPVHAREALETLPNTPDPVLRTYAETLVALAHGNLALARTKLTAALSREGVGPGIQVISAPMRRLLAGLAEMRSSSGVSEFCRPPARRRGNSSTAPKRIESAASPVGLAG